MEKREWGQISKSELAAFSIGVILFLVAILRAPNGFILVLDHANLTFHEGGHQVMNLVWPRWEPYGGTIGQLLIPFLVIANFWRAKRAIGVATGAMWLFENFLNIARYMADARTLALPLVGGGDHDWNTIFRHWNVLQYDTAIASAVIIAGWTGMAITSAWVYWRAWETRNVISVKAAL